MNHGERIPGKFFRPRRERPSPGAESALVTKTTGAPSEGIPQYPSAYSQALKRVYRASHGIPIALSRYTYSAIKGGLWGCGIPTLCRPVVHPL
jgi:hypothetical protein